MSRLHADTRPLDIGAQEYLQVLVSTGVHGDDCTLDKMTVEKIK